MTLQELFSDKSKWTRYTRARKADGTVTHPRSPDAASWCLYGGMEKCYRECPVLQFLNRYKVYPETFNDSQLTTFKDIQEVAKEIDLWMSQQNQQPQ